MINNKRDFALRQKASSIKTISDLVDCINFILRSYLRYHSVAISLSDIRNYSNLDDPGRYDVFHIPKKKKGEIRTISAPKGNLMTILRALNLLLSNCYLPPRFVTGFVYSSSVVDNARFHVGKGFVLNIDMKNFFDSIPYDMVIRRLTLPPFSFPMQVATAIANMSFLKSPENDRLVLAQGSPISPVLSNIYCESLDNDLYALSLQHNVIYSRYADDITFSSDYNVFTSDSQFYKSMEWSIQANGLKVNESKVRLQDMHHRQSVTGLTVNVKVNVTRKYIKDLRNLLYIWKRYGTKSAYQRFGIYYTKRYPQIGNKIIPNFVDYLRGKINYLGLVKGKDNHTFIHFISLFNELCSTKELKPFRVKSYRRVELFEKKRQKLNLTIDLPRINKYGRQYYAIDYPVPGGEILVSPKLYRFVELRTNAIQTILRNDCSIHQIYNKDGVKWILSENIKANISADVTRALNAEREDRINRLQQRQQPLEGDDLVRAAVNMLKAKFGQGKA